MNTQRSSHRNRENDRVRPTSYDPNMGGEHFEVCVPIYFDKTDVTALGQLTNLRELTISDKARKYPIWCAAYLILKV